MSKQAEFGLNLIEHAYRADEPFSALARVFLDLFAGDLEDLFKAVGLTFVPYKKGVEETSGGQKIAKVNFDGQNYLIPTAAYKKDFGSKNIYVWLGGKYARAGYVFSPTLLSDVLHSYTDLPNNSVVYEAILAKNNKNTPPTETAQLNELAYS